jgi:putative CocE/NonD family hydrolase
MMRGFFSMGLLFLLAGTSGAGAVADSSDYTMLDSLITTPGGAHISVLVARKKGANLPLPAILMFTVYARQTDDQRVMDMARHGYVGVMAYTRGKRNSTDALDPYEHDGEDADAVIHWIAQQSWCNGKVGMYGGSYNGFTQWAAAKHLPEALKTIVPSTPVAPGRDAPMTQGVFMSFPFPWIYYVSNNAFLDTADYDSPQWRKLYFQWYRAGTAYRTMDSLLGRAPNRTFRRWLDHPDYDQYWKNMIPYGQEFASIKIPILFTTGYYDGCQVSALYYYREHLKYVPGANDYLLVGPYGHFGAQGFPDSVYEGYTIDPVANLHIHDIIFEWFDYILKGGPKPSALQDRVNFEVMGANTWKHAPSLEAMADDTLHFYLGNTSAVPPPTLQHVADNRIYGLDPGTQPPGAYHLQRVDFKDRNSTNSYYYAFNILYDTLDVTHAMTFISEPLKAPLEINGNFFGDLHMAINKKDMDYSVNLFEETPEGKFFFLSYFMGRASYTWDISHRRLLEPGKETHLPFCKTYLTSRKLSKGSRIIILVNVNKSPFEMINYGTGKDVSRETIADAGLPLEVRWYEDSRISIPVSWEQ